MRFPDVNYLPEEHSCWTTIYTRLESMWPFTACKEFLIGYRILVNSGLLKKDRIPNITKISKFLESKTGFRLRPASGLCPAREFLACLAFRVFPCTLYMRHWSRPGHSPEPDLVHEILGHVPMFLNQVCTDRPCFCILQKCSVDSRFQPKNRAGKFGCNWWRNWTTCKTILVFRARF